MRRFSVSAGPDRKVDVRISLAEGTGGVWKLSPTLAADMAAFLQSADPEEFEFWVEDDDEA